MLTSEQVQSYKDTGFLSPIGVCDTHEVEYYRDKFNELEERVGQETSQIGLVDYHFQEEFIWQLATHPKILDAVEGVLGPNFMLLATHFFCKYGEGEEAKTFVAWHQDVTFWGLEPPYAMTAWYAVDDSDTENGCMQVIPSTHVSGIQEHGKADQLGNLLSINQEVSVTPAQEQTAADLVLKAGEMSLHDGTLIHGSLPNASDRRRCGLTLRYVPTWVKQTADSSLGTRWKGILMRGEDKEQNFGFIERPF
ncbi:MAG: phytanoyl-CoA dioxygenase family protein [Chloroflexota bacterium]